jgi:acyl-CoA thioesterase FadM
MSVRNEDRAVLGEHRQLYHLRHDELGPGGVYPMSALTGALLEAAIDGSAARGYPFCYSARERAAWVMRRIAFRYDAPLHFGDGLEVSTWVSRVGRTSPTREYRLQAPGHGLGLGRARTHWVYLDAVSGSPKPIPDDLRAAFAPTGEVLDELFSTDGQEPSTRGSRWTEERTVEASEVDCVGHLKCCRYVAWLEDAVSHAAAAAAGPSGTVLAGFDLQMVAPAHGGDRVRLLAAVGPAWQVELQGTDGRLLAKATLWPRVLDAARRRFADHGSGPAPRPGPSSR